MARYGETAGGGCGADTAPASNTAAARRSLTGANIARVRHMRFAVCTGTCSIRAIPRERSSRMQFLLALLTAAVAAASPSAALKRSDPVLVRTVVDGDTIDVTAYGRVRLIGIDAPEIGRVFDTSAPFAKEARDRQIGRAS